MSSEIEKTVSFAHILLDIYKEEEMKKHTPVTEAVLQSAQELTAILEGS